MKSLKGKISQEIIEVSDVESTGSATSAENISNCSQEENYINKNVSFDIHRYGNNLLISIERLIVFLYS